MFQLNPRRVWAASIIASLAMFAGAATAEEQAPPPKPYPLTTCIVSGGELGSMGDPVVIVHEGQEIKFCCAHCKPAFEKDPEKYLKKLKEAEKPATTQPSESSNAAE